MVGQGNKTAEAARFVLKGAELAEMVNAVFEGFDVAVKHRAGAAFAEFVPRAVDVEVFGGGFFSFGDGGADGGIKNFGAATREGVKTCFPQFAQSIADGFFGEAGEVKDFDGGKTFQLEIRIECAEGFDENDVVREGEIWMKAADDVKFGR